MNSYKLSFGTINVLQNDLAELIVNEGVLIDKVMIKQFHDFLINKFKGVFGLLVNILHSYSYTFGAQKTISKLNEIKSMAVVAQTSGAVMSRETLINVKVKLNYSKKKKQLQPGYKKNYLNKTLKRYSFSNR